MKFCLNDFLELNTNELLTVNGGYYCNGSSPSTTITPNTYYQTGGGSSGGGGGGGGCSAVNIPPKRPDPYMPITNGGTCSNINLGKYYKENKVYDDMVDSIESNKDKKYEKGEKPYMCDDWVAEVLRDAGHDVKDYFNGDEKDTVQMHIDGLKEGTYSKQVPTEKGVYVVFMNDGIISKNGNQYIPHAGLLIVDGSGKMTMWDNSSGNSTGGVEPTIVTKVSDTKISAFGYDSYYFQKVK